MIENDVYLLTLKVNIDKLIEFNALRNRDRNYMHHCIQFLYSDLALADTSRDEYAVSSTVLKYSNFNRAFILCTRGQ